MASLDSHDSTQLCNIWLQIPLSYVPEPVVKVTGDWLAKRPVSALSKFAALLLKIVLEEDGASSKGAKQAAVAATGKTQVSLKSLTC